MGGLKQELGLGQELGCFPPHCWVPASSPSRRWRRWSLAITACGHGRCSFSLFSRLPSSSPCWAAIFQRGRRGPLCRYGLCHVWPASPAGCFYRLSRSDSPPPCTSPPVLARRCSVGMIAQLLLAELGTAIVWWVGSRGASSSANLQTLVAVLIVALIVVVWWRGDKPGADPLPAPAEIDRGQLFSALSVMFWCFVGLKPSRISPRSLNIPSVISRALMIGLLLAGSVYWACTVRCCTSTPLARRWRGGVITEYRGPSVRRRSAVGSLRHRLSRLFPASLNIYIQSFARLVWSQAQHKPQLPRKAVATADPAQRPQRRAGIPRS